MEPTNGIVYLAWGRPARVQVRNSVASLKTLAPQANVCVFGDDEVQTLEDIADVRTVGSLSPWGSDGRFYAGRIKPLLYGLSPFERTCYVDADSTFVADPAIGFMLLDQWEFLVTDIGMHRSLADDMGNGEEAEYTRLHFGTSLLAYFCSGLLFWKRSENVEKLFELWSSEWERFSGWDEQLALLRALHRSDALYLTLSSNWNTPDADKAILLHHRYGDKSARRDGK